MQVWEASCYSKIFMEHLYNTKSLFEPSTTTILFVGLTSIGYDITLTAKDSES